MLLLLMGGIYKLGRSDGLRCLDVLYTNFMKICSAIQKLIGGIHIQTRGQTHT
jgi:hypothetical protein